MQIIPATHRTKRFYQEIPPRDSAKRFRQDTHARHAGRMSAGLLKQFFRRDGEAIGDLGRAIEDFQHVIAEGAVKFARGSLP